MPRPRIEDAQERLLAAGLQLFARLGSERVNSNAIAKRARLGIGTFYKHFEDKHTLLRELQSRTLAAIRAARIEALAGAGPEPEDQVPRAIAAVARFAKSHPEAYRVTYGRERAGASHRGPVLSESTRPIAEALKRLQSAGRVDPGLDPELAARAYLAMEVGTLLWWIEDPARASIGDLVATLSRLHPALAAASAVSRRPAS
jgi:AcrR family transcriptional regulator